MNINPFPKLVSFIDQGEYNTEIVMEELLGLSDEQQQDFAKFLLDKRAEDGVSISSRAGAVFKKIDSVRNSTLMSDQKVCNICSRVISYRKDLSMIVQFLEKNEISLTTAEINQIVRNGYAQSLGTSSAFESVLRSTPIINPRTYPTFYLAEILDNRGFDINFCLNNNVDTVKKLLEWDLKLQEPATDFLACLNQSNTPQEALLSWTTKADKATIDEWSKKPEQLDPAIPSYSVKSGTFVKSYGNQDIFNLGMNETVQLGAEGLKNKNWDFTSLMHFCAFRRMKIAYWQNEENYSLCQTNPTYHFGLPRGGPGFVSESNDSNKVNQKICSTRLVDTYQPLAGRLLQMHENQKPEDLADKEHLPEYFYSVKIYDDNHIRYNTIRSLNLNPIGVFYTTIKGEPIPLSCFVASPSTQFNLLLHTPPEFVEVLNKKCEEIYTKAMKEDSLDKILPLLGQINWLMCQAKPWFRGDPSIVEMMIRSILLSKGWIAPPWREGLIPWEESSVYADGEEYGHVFVNCFEDGRAGFVRAS